MKNKNKLIASVVTAVALFFAVNANAQTITPDKFRFGVGVDGGVVTGDAHNYSNIILGGTARVQYGVSKNVALTLTSGYYNFFGKTYDNSTGTKYQSLGMVPIKLGVKAFFTNNFYVGAEAGVGLETKTFNYQGVNEDFSEKHSKLLLSPAVGYATHHWDIGARYENFSGQDRNSGFVALRLAYGFGI